MKFLFVMDPISTVRPYKDTSYFLMLAAHSRGHDVYHCETNNLYFLAEAKAKAAKYKIKPHDTNDSYKEVFLNPEPSDISLNEFDVIWIRKDPPFDESYLYMTRLLSLATKPIIINSPTGLQTWNEKLAALEYTKWIPWTLVASDVDTIYKAINAKDGRFVLKPLDGFGGKGIEFITSNAKDTKQLLTIYLETQNQKPIIVQEYLKEASLGDKRILLWRGKPIGAVLRLHADGSELNNIDAGGKALKASITDNEYKLCEDLAPRLNELGLLFVGIDVIGEKLTEINITSPTTLQEMARLSNTPLHIKIIEDLEILTKK